MRTHQQRNGTLTDEERHDPAIVEVVHVVRDVDLLETMYPLAYALRDALFTTLVEKVGVRGPGRGLSVRLRNELNLTESATKAMKLKARRRRTRGEEVDERQAKAVLAAIRAAAVAYREVMNEGESEDANAA
ncbi:hypothetical protein [Streptomyces violaceusniger]|uniref:Uncharacterized protein n=1 Tax=Streptomyces violaceusniger (strain Tu 4113) TaxID=653045 RepID=G2PHN3_STRV4|nr:hypothetical protein [Streptomyces violaceusniger]AEM88834.1 hypothetical protein Strvi_0058 [Streptomyces violaceusniger Tu 4113]